MQSDIPLSHTQQKNTDSVANKKIKNNLKKKAAPKQLHVICLKSKSKSFSG